MVTSMSDLTRYFASGALVLFLSGCVSAGSVQTDFGSKTIFMSPHISVEVLRVILNDWGDIAEAIYQFRPIKCVRENLKIDSIVSLGSYQGRKREKYLSLAGITEQKNTIKVLSIGTKDPCLVDPTSSGPGWIVLYVDGAYKVLHVTYISE